MTLSDVPPLNKDAETIWSVITSKVIAMEVIDVIGFNQVDGLEVSVSLTSQNPPLPSTRRALVGMRGRNTRSPTQESRMLQMEQKLTFDVVILIQSVVTFHDVDRYVLGAFNDDVLEKAVYLSELKATRHETFANATSLSIVSTSSALPRSEPVDDVPDDKDKNSGKIAIIALFVGAGVAAIAVGGLILYLIRKNGSSSSRAASSVLEKVDKAIEVKKGGLSSEIDVGSHIGSFVSSLGDPFPMSVLGSISENTSSLNYDFKKAYQNGAAMSKVSSSNGDTKQLNSVFLEDDETLEADDSSLEAEYFTKDYVFEVEAPAGALGLVLETSEIGTPIVGTIEGTSPLAGQVQVGDQLMCVDGVDVAMLWASDAMRLIANKKHNPERRLMFTRRLGTGYVSPDHQEGTV